ncbi:MAG: hypothetical protein QF362_04700 [Candidatus Woesearchaeota archaeon]|jgi:hypothetical protein|nr:hypothetical protein [Candidatus Woesearchaeota archaeon]MDP7506712.1 hypothetical protein [Candidatus Woesearchaeota archaeon]|tara:strand:- start:11820 stop:12365 length:546 start_codon:yes stop_codon:yes gene_type:complete
MGAYLYLGIDESNHGRFPEIYVCVPSEFEKDIEEITLFSKVRKKKFIPKNEEYRHIIISELHKDMLGDMGISIATTVEFIQFFDRDKTLEKVIVDGECKGHTIEEIERTLYPHHIPKIEFIAKADKKLKVVNEADRIAYSLNKYYNEERHGEKGKYLKHLLTVKLEDYSELIERIQTSFTP